MPPKIPPHSQNSQQLFRRSRLWLACWYVLAMATILGLAGLGVYRALIQSNWTALEREIESTAGTLHDSLEPMLLRSDNPTATLQQILPDLCITGQPCKTENRLIQRHTAGISDPSTYYIRLFDNNGRLLAFSAHQPSSLSPQLDERPWQIISDPTGPRYRQFTTTLHHFHPQDTPHSHTHTHDGQESWGHLQVGRALAAFDAEADRIRWILAIGFLLALGLVTTASWGLSGLAMRPIYRSYQQQGQFTADVAHELRSPLASVLATIEAILRLSPQSQREVPAMLQTIERQSRRLSHLVTDLLLLTSLEQNVNDKPFQPCCLNDIVADLTEEFSELAAAANVELSQKILTSTSASSPEVYAWGQESQLYRLISNLLANAIQYTPANGSVHIQLAIQDRTALITVQDTGIGIAPDQQQRIFDRFYRVHGDRSRKTGGTGLGLAIAMAIVQRHSGQLRVESSLGQGSLFRLHLPILYIKQSKQDSP